MKILCKIPFPFSNSECSPYLIDRDVTQKYVCLVDAYLKIRIIETLESFRGKSNL